MKTLLVLLLLVVPGVAHAQHVVTLTTGHDHGLVVGAGYAHAISVRDRPILVGGDLTIGAAAIDASDFHLRAGALAPVIARGPWTLLAGLGATVRGTDNDLARMTDVGVDAAIHAGFYKPRGFAALELGADWAMATYVQHSDEYRMNVPDARDRWIGNAGSTVRAGVQGGVTVGRVDVSLRAGRLVTGAPMFPIYATLTVGTRF